MLLRLFLLLLLSLSCAAQLAAPPGPVNILFDTDMETDCDDAAALAVLHTLADLGECRILATVVSVRDPDSAATVDAINRYHARPELPVGLVKGPGVLEKSRYVARIAAEFPHRFRPGQPIPDAVHLYRDLLATQPDQSVTIVTVGYLTNLRGLLDLPAAGPHPSGLDLIKAKVTRWVCMGGNFIGDPPHDDLKLGNVNFQRDPTSALSVITRWPTPIVFAGREVCSVPSGLQLGPCLAQTPADNPVRRAYEHYFGGSLKNRHIADLATVLYAVRGLRDYWDLSPPGTMDLRPDMTFTWRPDATGRHAYLLKKRLPPQPDDPPGGRFTDRHIEQALTTLLTRPPGLSSPLK